jgi:hypothetical protein
VALIQGASAEFLTSKAGSNCRETSGRRDVDALLSNLMIWFKKRSDLISGVKNTEITDKA